MIQTIKEIISLANNSKKVLAVACAEDHEVLEAVAEADRHGMADPCLFGNEKKIREIMEAYDIRFHNYEIVDAKDNEDACKKAAAYLSEGKADLVMKGLVDTKVLLKAILNKELGLRKNKVLSHVMVYEMKNYPKLLMMTDGGMVMNPDLEDKKELILNAKEVADVFGIGTMKVAALSAVEKVNEKVQSTVDGQALKALSGTGDFKDILIEGPLALDNAISKEAAKHKGITSEVAGDVDLLLVPNFEAGNMLGKSFTYMADADSCGVIIGAKSPIILVSRADSSKVKFNSIALAVLLSNRDKA